MLCFSLNLKKWCGFIVVTFLIFLITRTKKGMHFVHKIKPRRVDTICVYKKHGETMMMSLGFAHLDTEMGPIPRRQQTPARSLPPTSQAICT